MITEEIENAMREELTPEIIETIKNGSSITVVLKNVVPSDYVTDDPNQPYKQVAYDALASLGKKWGFHLRMESYPTRTGGLFTLIISSRPRDNGGTHVELPNPLPAFNTYTPNVTTEVPMVMSAAVGKR